jgi:hypothetical protein
MAAVTATGYNGQISSVEGGGSDAYQHLISRCLGPLDFLQFNSLTCNDGGTHGGLLMTNHDLKSHPPMVPRTFLTGSFDADRSTRL